MTTKYCPSCKQEHPAAEFHKDKRTQSGLKCWCKTCVRSSFLGFKDGDGYQARLRKYASKRKDYRKAAPAEVWAHDTYGNAKKRATAAGLEFSLTKDALLSMLGGSCPLLGIPLTLGQSKSVDSSPTVDRKDPTKGYTIENCWVVSAKANRIKTNATSAEVAMVAEAMKLAGL